MLRLRPGVGGRWCLAAVVPPAGGDPIPAPRLEPRPAIGPGAGLSRRAVPLGARPHLTEKIQTVGGEVLTRDAGVIAFADTFDGHTFIGSEVVINKGPHPEADADFALFCTTVVRALT